MQWDDSVKEQALEYIRAHWEEFLRDLYELVAIPSVGYEDDSGYPYGKECARALDYVLALAKRKGLEVYNGGYHYGLASWGSGSHHIGIFSHVDVVAAGEGWIYPAFQCTQEQGWLIGRGVGDDKHAALLGILALCAVRDLNLSTNCRFTVYFGCCEERGMMDLDIYLKEQAEPELCLVPDIRFPVCIAEKGRFHFSLSKELCSTHLTKVSGGIAANIVPPSATVEFLADSVQANYLTDCEKDPEDPIEIKDCGEKNSGVTCFRITGHGKQSSSSMAFHGKNAVGVLFHFLESLPSLSQEEKAELTELDRLGTQWDGAVFGLACGDETMGALTCSCVSVSLEQGKICMDFDLRYPAIIQRDEVKTALESYAEAHGWSLALRVDSPPHCLDLQDGMVQLLYDCWSHVTGKNGRLFGIGGGTYARKLKYAIGFGPHDGEQCPFLPEGHGSIHGPDEARSLKNLMESVQIYITALWAIDKYL